jgi:hypothetical protein
MPLVDGHLDWLGPEALVQPWLLTESVFSFAQRKRVEILSVPGVSLRLAQVKGFGVRLKIM